MSSVTEALRAAAQRLADAGVPTPARDASVLLGHAAGGSYLGLDALPADVRARFDAAIARREAREPVSHIIGRRAFWRHDFTVSADVLDPRPETETLVEAALSAPFRRVLDLGTGSGCILLSLLADAPGTTGLGVDLSPAALKVARRNATALGLADRAEFVQSDWFSALSGRFDLIVSNPPYIAAAEMPGLAPELREHEPALALTDGGDGLGAYRAIAMGLSAHLAPGGRVFLEIGPTQAEAVRRLLDAAGLTDLRVLPDLDGRDRVVAARAP